MLNQDCVERTLQSYQDAFARLLEISPFVQLHGGGSTVIDCIGGRVEVASSVSIERVIPHATAVHVRMDELFDYGRPREIQPSYWIWRCSFFKVRFVVQEPWDAYRYRPKMVSTEGDEQPARIEPQRHFLCLHSQEKSWGLGKWESTRKEREQLIENATSQVVVDDYRQALGAADSEVAKWLEAVNGRPKVVLA